MSNLNKNPEATIKIEGLEPIVVELYLDVPNSTYNFIKLASEQFYDNLTFHRIIPGFVAQGGCPTGNGTGNPGYTIDGEFKSNGFNNPHSHEQGVIAWARSMARNSAGCQFYLTFAPIPHLDDDYAVFGKIISGLDQLMQLEQYGSNSGEPSREIKIETIKIETFGQEIPAPEIIKK